MLNMTFKRWIHENQDNIVVVNARYIKDGIYALLGKVRDIDGVLEDFILCASDLKDAFDNALNSVEAIIDVIMTRAFNLYADMERGLGKKMIKNVLERLINELKLRGVPQDVALEYIEAWEHNPNRLDWEYEKDGCRQVATSDTDENTYTIYTEDSKMWCLTVNDDFEVWYNSLELAQEGAMKWELGTTCLEGSPITYEDAQQLTMLNENELDNIIEESVDIIAGFEEFEERVTRFLNLGRVFYRLA